MLADPKREKALLQVKNLIERLRAAQKPAKASKEGKARPQLSHGVGFFRESLGGMSLGGIEASQYRECLEALTALREERPNAVAVSPAAVERLLQTTILRSLRVAPSNVAEPQVRFRRRLNAEIRLLRKALLAAPEDWVVSLPVHGFAHSALPMTFGGIDFSPGTPEVTAKIVGFIPDYAPARRVDATKARLEQELPFATVQPSRKRSRRVRWLR